MKKRQKIKTTEFQVKIVEMHKIKRKIFFKHVKV